MFVIKFCHRVYVQTIQRQKMFKKRLLFNHLTPIKIGEKIINKTLLYDNFARQKSAIHQVWEGREDRC